jgi:crotonobetainyl-CoA:carnitine CoA-transferase CaiB-like acyl-CoA transferase
MGVGWAAMSARKPGLVYVSITGWGASGPMAKVPTLDTTMQAASGIMHANRGPDGKPRRVGLYLVDLATGLYAAQATLAALLRQARTGQGRHVEVSMLETAAALLSYQVIDGALYPGTESAVNAPTGIFETRDGKPLYISMLNDAMFKRLAQALDLPDWLADASLHTSAGRLPRAAELVQALAGRVAQSDLDALTDRLAQSDILFAVVRAPAELPQDAQARHLGIYAEQLVDGLGTVPLAGLPGGVDLGTLPAAPRLGAHNAQILD